MKSLRLLAFLFASLSSIAASAQLTINLPAGGDIVLASNQVLAAGGGTINLAAGNYYINNSIVLGNNMTINGAGGPGSATQTVIYAPASPNSIAMITGAYEGVRNIAISNLVLDGNIPQAAMLYGTGNGNYSYNNTGIYVYSQSATSVGMKLTNVEVRHTLRGILTGLVNTLTISGCYFHDNNPGGFSHNMYLVATSGVEIDHTRSDNAITGDGLHIDFGGYFYTIRKSEFSGNNGLGLLSQQDNSVTIEDSKIDFNTNDGLQIDAAGLVLDRNEMNFNGNYGLNIPDTADGNGQVNGIYTVGDGATDYFYGANIQDFTLSNPNANVYAAIQATGVTGVEDTADWTLNYPGYTYMGAVDFNANHLANGSITFPYVGAAIEGTPGSGVGSYQMAFRYSNGTDNNQTLNLSINGAPPVPITFPPTGSYSTWSTVNYTGILNVGNSTVTLSVPTGATSAPELDTLTVNAPTPNAPNAPTNLTGTATGPYSVLLNWTAPAGGNDNAAQTYTIYRNGAYPPIAINVTGTSYTDSRIFYGETTNSYFVVANNQGGSGQQSNTVSVTTGIDAPPGLTVSTSPKTLTNTLNWLGTSGAASYIVQRSAVNGGPYQTIGTVAANTPYPTFADNQLSAGANYFYVVAAIDHNNVVSANSYQVESTPVYFYLTSSSAAVTITSTGTAQDTISVVGASGFSDAVHFALSGLPAGVTASLSNASGSSTVITFTTSPGAVLGQYALTVTGTDGALTQSIPLTLNLGQPQTINFPTMPAQAVGNTISPYATASSGLPVSFTVVQNGNCTTTGTTVTFVNAGACGIIAHQNGNANVAPAPTVGQVVTVNSPQSQTITFGAISTQSAGSTIPLTASASSGLPVSFASSTPGICAVSGGTASLLTSGTCSIVASQSGANAYGPAPSVTQSFTVTTPQTIAFTPASPVTYGVSSIALKATGGASGNPVTFTLVSGPATLSGSTLTITGAGTVVVAANQAGNANYSAAAQVTASIVVNPATPTITWSAPAAITYGTTLSSTQLNAVATGIGGTSLAGTFTYSPAAGSTPAGGTDTLSVSFTPTDTTDYTSPVTATTTLTVNQAAQTIAFAPVSAVTYGTSPIALTATGGASGNPVTFALVSGPATLSGNTLTVTGTGTVVVAANQAGNANYAAAAQVTASIAVNPASQSIAFSTVSAQTVGTPLNLSGYATASSGLPVTFTVIANGNCSVSGTTVTLINPGTCGIIANQAGNGNYSAAAAVGQVVLVKANQTITFAPVASVTYGVSPIALTATGGASGNPVIFSLVSGPATLSGNTLTVTGAGTIVVAANQAGTNAYAAAPQVTASIAVNPASETITFNPIPAQTVGSTVNLSNYATASSGLPVSFTYVPNGICTVSGTTATFLAAGPCGIVATQAGNSNYTPATSIGQVVQVTN
jgi:hypothetical protein